MEVSEVAERLGSMAKLPESMLQEIRDLDSKFDEWKKTNGVIEFVVADAPNSERIALLQESHEIWTRCYGSEEYGAVGFCSFPGMNFGVLGWWVATKPWVEGSNKFVQLSIDFPCPTCQSDEEITTLCPTCQGDTVFYAVGS